MNRSREQALLEIGYKRIWVRELRRVHKILQRSGQFKAARWIEDYLILGAEAAKRLYVLVKPGKTCDRITALIRDCKSEFVP